MTGNFDDDAEEHVDSDSATLMATTHAPPAGPDIEPVDKGDDRRASGGSDLVTDTVAAVVSAVLALVFLLLMVCIIRAIRKRRRERQGNRLNQPIVHTVTPGVFTANMAAYAHVPIAGNLSWEPVTSSAVSTSQSQFLEDSLFSPDSYDENRPSTSSSAGAAHSRTSAVLKRRTSDELPVLSSGVLPTLCSQIPSTSRTEVPVLLLEQSNGVVPTSIPGTSGMMSVTDNGCSDPRNEHLGTDRQDNVSQDGSADQYELTCSGVLDSESSRNLS